MTDKAPPVVWVTFRVGPGAETLDQLAAVAIRRAAGIPPESEPSPGWQWVSVGPGHAIASPFTAIVDDSARSGVLEVVFEVDADGDLRVQSISATARPDQQLADDALRVPLATIKTRAEQDRYAVGCAYSGPELPPGTPVPPEQLLYPMKEPWSATPAITRRRVRRRMTDAHLEEVADVYWRARSEGYPVRRAIVEHFAREHGETVTENTARNWAQHAKARYPERWKESE